jgi:hypothetical protein
MNTASTNLTEYQQHLIDWAKKDAKSKAQDWPGFPLVQIPLVAKGDLHLLVSKGLLSIVERPSKTNPARTSAYVVATNA